MPGGTLDLSPTNIFLTQGGLLAANNLVDQDPNSYAAFSATTSGFVLLNGFTNSISNFSKKKITKATLNTTFFFLSTNPTTDTCTISFVANLYAGDTLKTISFPNNNIPVNTVVNYTVPFTSDQISRLLTADDTFPDTSFWFGINFSDNTFTNIRLYNMSLTLAYNTNIPLINVNNAKVKGLTKVNSSISTNKLIGVIDPGSPRSYTSGSNFAYTLPTSVTASISDTIKYNNDSKSFEFEWDYSVEPRIEVAQHILAYDAPLHLPTPPPNPVAGGDLDYMYERKTNLTDSINVFSWRNGSIGIWLKLIGSDPYGNSLTDPQYIFDAVVDPLDRDLGYKSIYYIPFEGISFEITDGVLNTLNTLTIPNTLDNWPGFNNWFYLTFTWQESTSQGSNDAVFNGYINGELAATTTGDYFVNGTTWNSNYLSTTLNTFNNAVSDDENNAFNIYTNPIYIGNKIPI